MSTLTRFSIVLSTISLGLVLLAAGCFVPETGSENCPGDGVMTESTCSGDTCSCAASCTTNSDCESGCCAQGYCAFPCVCRGEGTVEQYCTPEDDQSGNNQTGESSCPGDSAATVSTCPGDTCSCAAACTANSDCESGCCAEGYCSFPCVCQGEGTVELYCSSSSESNDDTGDSGGECVDRTDCLEVVEEVYRESDACLEGQREVYVAWRNSCSETIVTKSCIVDDAGQWVCDTGSNEAGTSYEMSLCTETNQYWLQALGEGSSQSCFSDPS